MRLLLSKYGCKCSWSAQLAVVTLSVVALLLGSCHHKKDLNDDKRNYRNEYAEDIYTERKPKNDGKSKLYREVESWLGVPYRYGGHSRKGTDCSGLVMEVYRNVYGVAVTHNSSDLYQNECRHIKERELREGDLVFFAFNKQKRINHVGIYLGKGQFAHASSSKGVIISNLDEAYYRRGFIGAGRIKSL